jgi:hypothetical protein
MVYLPLGNHVTRMRVTFVDGGEFVITKTVNVVP